MGRRGSAGIVALAILAALAALGHRADSSADDFLTSLKDRLSCSAYVTEERASPDGTWIAERQNVDCSGGAAEPQEAVSLRRPGEASAFRSRRSLMTGDEYPWLFRWVDDATIEVGTDHADRFRQQDPARRVRFSFVALTPPACAAPGPGAIAKGFRVSSRVTHDAAGSSNVGCELTLDSDPSGRRSGTFIRLEASKQFGTTSCCVSGRTTTSPERTDVRFHISQREEQGQLENPVTCVTAGGLGDFARASLLFDFKPVAAPYGNAAGWQMSRPLSEKELRSILAEVEAGSFDVDLFQWRSKSIERITVAGPDPEPVRRFEGCLAENRIFDPDASP